MRCALLTVGKPKAKFFREGIEEYRKRLKAWGGCELMHVRPAAGNLPRPQAMELEAQRLLGIIKRGDCLWAMDMRGKPMSSEQWAQAIAQAGSEGFKRLVVVIGGHAGLGKEVVSSAQRVVSLGPVTLSHELAALVVMEQLYRAHCILSGHPYHRR